MKKRLYRGVVWKKWSEKKGRPEKVVFKSGLKKWSLRVVLLKKWSYNTTLLTSVNTIARGIFCGARYTQHSFTPIIKHN